MQDVLNILTPADYTFLVGLLESSVNLTDDSRLRSLLATVEAFDTEESRAALNRQLERQIRYLGSADLAFLFRQATGQEPGVAFSEIVRDVAQKVKVAMPHLGTNREMVERVAEDYATQQFADLSPEAQQRLLVDLGVEQERAAAFIKKSAGVFTLPALIAAFDVIVVQGLVKHIIFGAIAKILGGRLAGQLFRFVAGRFPWWLRWVGPAAWTVSISWTVLDLQGPAYRKTIPAVLYLGLCSIREREGIVVEG